MKQRKMLIKGMTALAVAALTFMILMGVVFTSCDTGTQQRQMIKPPAPRVSITELTGYGYKLVWEPDVGVLGYQVWRTQGSHPPQLLGQTGGFSPNPYHNLQTEEGYWVCYDVVDLDNNSKQTLEANLDYEYTVLSIPLMGSFSYGGMAQDAAAWTKKVKPQTILNEMDGTGFAAALRIDPLEKEFVITFTPPSNPVPGPRSASVTEIWYQIVRNDGEEVGANEDGTHYSGSLSTTATVPFSIGSMDFSDPLSLTVKRPWPGSTATTVRPGTPPSATANGFGSWEVNASAEFYVKAGYSMRLDANQVPYNQHFNPDGETSVEIVSNTVSYEALYGSGSFGRITKMPIPQNPSNSGNTVIGYYVEIDVTEIQALPGVTYTIERTLLDEDNDVTTWKKIDPVKRFGLEGTFWPVEISDMQMDVFGSLPVDTVYDNSLPVAQENYKYRMKATKGSSVDIRDITVNAATTTMPWGTPPPSQAIGIRFPDNLYPGLWVSLKEKKAPTEDKPNGEIIYRFEPTFEGFMKGWLRGNERLEVYWFVADDPRTAFLSGSLFVNEESKIVFDADQIEQYVDGAAAFFDLTVDGPEQYDLPGTTTPSGYTNQRLFLIANFYDDEGELVNLGMDASAPRGRPSVLATQFNPYLRVAVNGSMGYLGYMVYELGSYSDSSLPYQNLP